MSAITSSIFQRWVQMVNPANDFDYTGALLQFALSNPLIDVALVGMRTAADVKSSVSEWRNLSRRIDINALWGRYVEPPAS
jgi:hypothetical protein